MRKVLAVASLALAGLLFVNGNSYAEPAPWIKSPWDPFCIG